MFVKLTNVEFDFPKGAIVGTPVEKDPVYINLDQVIAITPTSYGCFIQTTGIKGGGSLSSGTLTYSVKESAERVLRYSHSETNL